jgi:hypothetical protein
MHARGLSDGVLEQCRLAGTRLAAQDEAATAAPTGADQQPVDRFEFLIAVAEGEGSPPFGLSQAGAGSDSIPGAADSVGARRGNGVQPIARDNRGRSSVGAVNGDELAKLRRPELYRWHALVLSTRVTNTETMNARGAVEHRHQPPSAFTASRGSGFRLPARPSGTVRPGRPVIRCSSRSRGPALVRGHMPSAATTGYGDSEQHGKR